MKQKILLIGPCLSMGGMERAAVNTANGLEDTGLLKVLFVSLFKRDHFFKLKDNIKLIEPDGFNENKLSIAKTIHWIRHTVKTEKPDSVVVFNKLYAAITALALIGISVPFYVSERSSPLYVWRQPFRLINSLAFWLKPPKGVIAQTSIAADYQKKYFTKSLVKVIPNMVRSVDLFPEIPRKEIILAVGRLGDHLKGFDLLLESFALLQNKNWELHIAGGDENGNDLKDQAQKLGIAHRVQFLGKIKDIDSIFAGAGIFVIPSRSEGFPNALCEAMAAGLSCIAFDFIAGPRDIIEDGISGIIVENGNIEKLAENIDYLIDHPEKRVQLGQSALNIREKFSQSLIINEIIDLLELKK